MTKAYLEYNGGLTMIDPKKLLDLRYLLDPLPQAESGYLKLGYLFVGMVLVAFLIWLMGIRWIRHNPAYRTVRNRLATLWATIGVLGLIYLFFRSQAIPYFGARIVLVMIVVLFLLWNGWILWYSARRLPMYLREEARRQKFLSYLPKKKHNP